MELPIQLVHYASIAVPGRIGLLSSLLYMSTNTESYTEKGWGEISALNLLLNSINWSRQSSAFEGECDRVWAAAKSGPVDGPVAQFVLGYNKHCMT